MSDIKRVAVIGAGTMGAGIAAQLANAGMAVVLMDIPQGHQGYRYEIAAKAIQQLLKAEPAPLMHKKYAALITPSHTDNLDDLSDCDWIIEAIVEKIDAKQQLYHKLASRCRPDAIISSNTSTIPLAKLIKGLPVEFQRRFLITHFFNPPRYMRLLELIKGPQTLSATVDKIADFADRVLGKTVVSCYDTPGFIANRIGTFWLQTALLKAIQYNVTVEEADALLSKPLGIPKTGVFGLMDLIGIDVMSLISRNMVASLAATDLYCQTYREPELITRMIAGGYTGRKGKGGFYRLITDEAQKRKQVLDLQTGQYRDPIILQLTCSNVVNKGLQQFLGSSDQGAKYARDVMLNVLWYSTSLIPEIADDIYSIDTAMKLGYAWKWGPFELIDRLGVDWVIQQFSADKRPIPDILNHVRGRTFYQIQDGHLSYLDYRNDCYDRIPRPTGILLLADIKNRCQPIAKNASASLWDIGDRVVCLEFTTKMNTLDLHIIDMIEQSIDIVSNHYQALVIYNEAEHFSAGANLESVLSAANRGMWTDLEVFIHRGQKVFTDLKYAPFPVVAAPSGMAVGGGCEILLHADAIQAHAELYCGLVEVGVGIVPAWGGCKEMLIRSLSSTNHAGNTMVALNHIFEMIGTARVSRSAFEAQDMMILREDNKITMNRDRLLADAKVRALELVPGYQPSQPALLSLPSNMAWETFLSAVTDWIKTGKASAHDEIINHKLAYILSGGATDITDTLTEADIMKLEFDAFMELIRQPKTWARMEHMLATGKALKN